MLSEIKTLQREVGFLKSSFERLVAEGEIQETDDATQRVRVRLPGNDDLVTGWLPVLTRRAQGDCDYWMPEVGEQVVCLFLPLAGLERGFVIGATYNEVDTVPVVSPNKRRIAFSDGAVLEYDKKKHQLDALLPSGGKTKLVSDGGVSIIGDVDVTGNITASGDVTDKTRSMAADRDIYNAHTHLGVVLGPAATQKTPNQQ